MTNLGKVEKQSEEDFVPGEGKKYMISVLLHILEQR